MSVASILCPVSFRLPVTMFLPSATLTVSSHQNTEAGESVDK